MRNKYRYLLMIILLFSLLSILIGCSKQTQYDLNSEPLDTQDENEVSKEKNKSDEYPVDKKTPSSIINPLTGLPATEPELLDRRPVMVKVSNFPREGRPHAGLSLADIVFEYYIGYGTNRFLALFYGQDAYKIGPVRSGRRVDAELVTMYSGILGYGSADEDTDSVLVTALGNYALSYLEAECPAFCGKDTHSATGVFANSGAISTHINSQGWENSTPDLPGMVFNETPPIDMQPAEQITILFNFYNRGEWHYDAESSKYLRWIEYIENESEEDQSMEMIPLVDRLTGEQLAYSNILILFANYTELAPSAHEIEIWGNNNGLPAYLFRDGGLVQGNWASVNDSDPLQFFTPDGSPMALKPGNTWIVIMGLSSTFSEVQPGQWESFFFLP